MRDPRITHQGKVGIRGTSWDEEWRTWPPPPSTPRHSHVPGPLGAAGFFLPGRAPAWKTRLGEGTSRALPAFEG